jgi:hypothetical protein
MAGNGLTAVLLEPPTVGSLWRSTVGRPVSNELFGWPPDLFAMTATVLERSEAFRFAMSPPIGRQWPPASSGDWSAEVEAAGRGWAGSVDESPGSAPPMLADALGVLLAGIDTPLEQLSSGADWRICQALLTLHAIADEACAGLGVALTASNPGGCCYRGRAREMLARRGTLARIPTHVLRVLPKARTPAAAGTSIRSLSRYVTMQRPGVSVQWHKVPARRRGIEPRSEHVNFLLLPWPLRVRGSDFRPVEGSVHRDTHEPYGLFDFDPSERLDLDLVDRMLRAALEEADSVDVLCLPESAIAEDEVAPLEALLESYGVASLTAGVRGRRSRPDEHPGNWIHIGVTAELEKGRGRSGRDPSTGWFHIRQNKQHRWSLDTEQIYQYHLGGELHPAVRWWEGLTIPNRMIHFIEFGEGPVVVFLVCEDLAQSDDIADLVRSVGPTTIAALLLDGPQLASRWAARYASVMADDPGSGVLTLTCWGLVDRCRPHGRDAARVIGLWKDPTQGLLEIPLEPGAQGVLLAGCANPSERRSSDGRRPVPNSVDFYEVGVHQITPADPRPREEPSMPPMPASPPLDIDELTILCSWAEAVAEALAYASDRVGAVVTEARAGSSWRGAFGLDEPSLTLAQAIDILGEFVATVPAGGDRLDAALAALGALPEGDTPMKALVRPVLRASLEMRLGRLKRESEARAT